MGSLPTPIANNITILANNALGNTRSLLNMFRPLLYMFSFNDIHNT